MLVGRGWTGEDPPVKERSAALLMSGVMNLEGGLNQSLQDDFATLRDRCFVQQDCSGGECSPWQEQ